MRRSAKTDSVATAALIGFATVLVPCGVTLSMELLAITSGSPVAGAAVMSGFVAGTAPLFAALGYLFRRSSQTLSGKLAVLTGVVVLSVAAWTMGSALQAGWRSFDTPENQSVASGPFIVEGGDGSGNGKGGTVTGEGAPVRIDASGKQTAILTVTDFHLPTQFTARASVPTTLLLRGKDSGGCARDPACACPGRSPCRSTTSWRNSPGSAPPQPTCGPDAASSSWRRAPTPIPPLSAAVEAAGEYTARPAG